jgi:hypothetical protein
VQEVAQMFAECACWADPAAGGATASAGGQRADGMGAPPGRVDLASAAITEAAFRVMLTEYWAGRKYGAGAPRGPFADMLETPGVAEPWVARLEVEGVAFLDGRQKEGQLPTPSWVQELVGTHTAMPPKWRRPEFFWLFLRRKMEQLLLLQEEAGVEEPGLLRKQGEADITHFAGGWFVRDTESSFSAVWDLMQVVLLVYVCISVPYQTGFDLDTDVGSLIWWWELWIDLYFLIDIGLNFRTPFYDRSGRLVYSSRGMALNYCKGWFFIDIASCASLLQYIFLVSGSGDPSSASKTRATKGLRLLKMAKLLRLARLKRIFERLDDEVLRMLAPVGNILVLLIGTAFAMHLISCFWYLAGTSEGQGAEDEYQGERQGWVNLNYMAPQNVSIGKRYLASLYGIFVQEFQLRPTTAEMGFALVSVIVNGFIYGAVAATLSSILVMLRAPHAEYNSKMDGLKAWMRSRKLHRTIREQVAIFYDIKLSGSEGMVIDEAAIIAQLQPAPLASELVQVLYAQTIERVPFFAKLEEEVIVRLCLMLKGTPALKGSPVVHQGRLATEMYIINAGRLQVWETPPVDGPGGGGQVRARCSFGGNYFWANVREDAKDAAPAEQRSGTAAGRKAALLGKFQKGGPPPRPPPLCPAPSASVSTQA